MNKVCINILCICIACLYGLFLSYPSHHFHKMEISTAWADHGDDHEDDHGDDHEDDHGDDHEDDHGDDHEDDHGDDHGGGACSSGDGKVTLDVSRGPVTGGGAVWSNNSLVVDTQATKNQNVSIKVGTNFTTIVNTPGDDGVLEESPTEFDTTTKTYTNLKDPGYSGNVSPLNYFDDPSGQLFDFSRYKQAAIATNNTFTWTEFRNKVAMNEHFYGIVYVTIDANGDTQSLQQGSVNVEGTLVVDLINGTPDFKVKIEVPLNINPVTSPTTGTTLLSPSDYDTWSSAAAARSSTSDPFPWPSGYENAWNDLAANHPDKDPRGINLGDGYQPFGPKEDMPALMYAGGIVDIHHDTNISGVVYTPDFVELEQKQQNHEVQYISGMIIAGNGIYLESNNCGGGIAVVYDPDTIDSLQVNPTPSTIMRRSWKKQ